MLAEQVAESWTPSSEPEKAAVQQQLEKLLATPLFNSSKRYPSFLKYVVTHSLAGQTDQLKERILGVEIFGRPADYDTNTDPIVRVTAAEIRKRIEQYYQDPKHSPGNSAVPARRFLCAAIFLARTSIWSVGKCDSHANPRRRRHCYPST